MKLQQRYALALLLLVLACQPVAGFQKDETDALQGVWNAKSIEADGKLAPDEAVQRMRFTFKGDKLLIKGNTNDDTEEECAYQIDAKQSPKQLDIKPPKEKKAIQGIYELKDDELKICLRHASQPGGRPKDFDTKADKKVVIVVFKRQKA